MNLPVVVNPNEASRAEEKAFAVGDAHDAKEPHGDAHALAHHDEHDAHTTMTMMTKNIIALPADFHPHESPWTMTVPLIVLAILSTFGGLVGIPYALSSLSARTMSMFLNIRSNLSLLKFLITNTETTTRHSANTKRTTNLEHSQHATDKAEHATEAEHAAHSPEEIRTERLLAGLSVF